MMRMMTVVVVALSLICFSGCKTTEGGKCCGTCKKAPACAVAAKCQKCGEAKAGCKCVADKCATCGEAKTACKCAAAESK